MARVAAEERWRKTMAEHQRDSEWNVAEWHGKMLVDRDGEKIKDQVKAAPNIEQHGDELSQADESVLYHHYELNYTPPNTESGRRLARR
jgi:hypothetical protein